MAITLENQILRALVNPEQGTSIMAFFVKKNQTWLSLMPDTRQESTGLDCASFLMIPYSNRIENGLFFFEGEKYQLANGENHAVHGDVRFRAWSTEEASARHIRCKFDSTVYRDINWPWPFEGYVEYNVEGNKLASELELRNCGDTPMPAGFGWHPYFNRELTREGETVHLCLKVEGAYPDAYDSRIPSGPPEPLTAEQDFSEEKPLARDLFLDTCFQGYNGDGYIVWPESGVKLTFECSAVCSHLVIYNPGGKPHFAVEPVTNANNGVNLYAAGEPNSGIVSLLPGESLDARFVMRVDML